VNEKEDEEVRRLRTIALRLHYMRAREDLQAGTAALAAHHSAEVHRIMGCTHLAAMSSPMVLALMPCSQSGLNRRQHSTHRRGRMQPPRLFKHILTSRQNYDEAASHKLSPLFIYSRFPNGHIHARPIRFLSHFAISHHASLLSMHSSFSCSHARISWTCRHV